jgi:tRNA(Glu) U13 pseudouridine synthase TruD
LFFIRLRPTVKAKKVKKSFLKEQVALVLKDIQKNGFPNYFGIQRF